MTGVPILAILALLLWGVLVGMDLVTVPQMLISRPIVAATVAGWLLGDVEGGARIGVLLELFALDVLPVGASRYPDYGPAAVGAATLAAGQPWLSLLGPATVLGLGMAALGGWTLQGLRHANARSLQARSAALAAGDAGAIRALQYAGLLRDALRSLLLTAAALLLAFAARKVPFAANPRLEVVGHIAIAAGLAAAVGGALRNAGHDVRLRWLGVGAAAATLWVLAT
jgi:mannose/fructose/N-acetylgalactosamine-specific phosphotransferase system component IIC